MLINSHCVILQTQKKKEGGLQKHLQICVAGRDMPEGLCQCVFKAAERYYQSQFKNSYSQNQGASASVFTAVGD